MTLATEHHFTSQNVLHVVGIYHTHEKDTHNALDSVRRSQYIDTDYVQTSVWRAFFPCQNGRRPKSQRRLVNDTPYALNDRRLTHPFEWPYTVLDAR